MSQAIRVSTDPWKIPIEDLGYSQRMEQHLRNIENDAVHKARLLGHSVPKLAARTTVFDLQVTCTVVLNEVGVQS